LWESFSNPRTTPAVATLSFASASCR
jgi:hypothetical protein